MEQLATQAEYWDIESSGDDYCRKQIDGLKQFAVLEMVDAALAKAAIVAPKRILEIGGGSQFVARHLSERFPNAEIICTDISAQRVEAFDMYFKVAPKNLTTKGGVDARGSGVSCFRCFD